MVFNTKNVKQIKGENNWHISDYLISTENINLIFGNKLEKLKMLFVSGSWGSLNALGKFVFEAYKKREQNLT